jgi:hypothetical protein
MKPWTPARAAASAKVDL